MSDKGGFFQLILLGFGVMTVFTLLAQMSTLGVSGPWAEVNILIAPLVFVIITVGFLAYLVTHR